MKSNYFKKILLSFIVIFLIDLFSSLISNQGLDLNVLFWQIISTFLIVILLGYYLKHTTIYGMKLVFILFTIYFLTAQFNILIEAYIFNVTDRTETVSQIIFGFIHSLIIAPLFVIIFDRWKGENNEPQFQKRSLWGWIWRVLVSILIYLFLYLLAGFTLQATYPQLHEFYAGKIPTFQIMIGTQFLRAPIFFLVAIIIFKTLNRSNLTKAIYVGLFFAILGGIAPLIIPNPLMPTNIRLAHLFEVIPSNFALGFFLTYLSKQKTIESIP